MKVDMIPGSSYDLVSSQEMEGHVAGIAARMQEFVRAETIGVKPFRITSAVKAVTASPFTVVSTSPQSGYCWAVLRVTFVGDAAAVATPILFRANDASIITLTAAGTPDLTSGRFAITQCPQGQAQSFPKGGLILNAGESLVVGVFDATAVNHNYRIVAEGIEVPAEMISKLLL